jgi:AAA domain
MDDIAAPPGAEPFVSVRRFEPCKDGSMHRANANSADGAKCTARALQNMIFPAIKFIVPRYLVEGCTLLAGAPKLGKSWLALEIALAVADGGKCFGNLECEQGDVLYLALEDNMRRLQGRMRKLVIFGDDLQRFNS